MRTVIQSFALTRKTKNRNLVLVGTIPVPHSKAKRSPAERRDKRYLVRRGATVFKRVAERPSHRGEEEPQGVQS